MDSSTAVAQNIGIRISIPRNILCSINAIKDISSFSRYAYNIILMIN